MWVLVCLPIPVNVCNILTTMEAIIYRPYLEILFCLVETEIYPAI